MVKQGTKQDLSTPAASYNEKSITRHHKMTGARRIAIFKMEKKKLKDLWLRLYRVSGNTQVASDRVGKRWITVLGWLNEDEQMRATRDSIRDTWDGLLKGRFKALGDESVKVVEGILEDSDADPALRVKIAQWVLKSQGVGVERSATSAEHSGPGGGPIPIKGIIVHTKAPPALVEHPGHGEAPQEVVEAEYTVESE